MASSVRSSFRLTLTGTIKLATHDHPELADMRADDGTPGRADRN
jgi:hypothetical protein